MAKISDDAAVVAAATLIQAEAYLKKTAGAVPEDGRPPSFRGD